MPTQPGLGLLRRGPLSWQVKVSARHVSQVSLELPVPSVHTLTTAETSLTLLLDDK